MLIFFSFQNRGCLALWAHALYSSVLEVCLVGLHVMECNYLEWYCALWSVI